MGSTVEEEVVVRRCETASRVETWFGKCTVEYGTYYQNLFLVYAAGTNELYIISRQYKKRLQNNMYLYFMLLLMYTVILYGVFLL